MGASPHGPEPCASAKFRQSPSNGTRCSFRPRSGSVSAPLRPEGACFGWRRAGYIESQGPAPPRATEGGRMGILRNFERRLDAMFEGFFARALPGGGVQPVELGKRMVRIMDEQKKVSVANVYVPNEFTFFLSSKDIELLRPVENAIGKELGAVARSAAASEGWRLLGPPVIRLVEDDSAAPGTFRVEGAVVEGADAEA